MLFAYFGPETILPLASVLATVFGVVMMFGRLSFRIALAPFRWIAEKARKPSASAVRGPAAWRRPVGESRRDAVAAETREEA